MLQKHIEDLGLWGKLPCLEMTAEIRKLTFKKGTPQEEQRISQQGYYGYLSDDGVVLRNKVGILLPREHQPYAPGVYFVGGGSFKVEAKYDGKLQFDPFSLDLVPAGPPAED
jgi:hypothetical protein